MILLVIDNSIHIYNCNHCNCTQKKNVNSIAFKKTDSLLFVEDTCVNADTVIFLYGRRFKNGSIPGKTFDAKQSMPNLNAASEWMAYWSP